MLYLSINEMLMFSWLNSAFSCMRIQIGERGLRLVVSRILQMDAVEKQTLHLRKALAVAMIHAP